MALPRLTYEDYKSRISIQELLQDAGYVLNRKDGLRYPSYVRLGSDGRRVSGDKYIISGKGNCCFRPPERKNYNIISFIKEHPHFFADYRPGMSLDRLVNVVCHRLLNQPLEERQTRILDPIKERKPFTLMDYEISSDWKHIARFLIPRQISKSTQYAFADFLKVATKKRDDGKRYGNLVFPMTIPGKPTVVGFEERGFPNKDGKSSYKGLAAGSDGTHGLWIANLSKQPIEQARHIYWFESGYDAMSYYQLNENDKDINNAVFVSTSGSPSQEQFKGMLNATPNAVHHLCFDRDRAVQMFCINFALTQYGKDFNTMVTDDGRLVVNTSDKKHEYPMADFDFEAIAKDLNLHDSAPYPMAFAEYVDSIVHPDDMMSGDMYLLEGEAGRAYGKYESLCEEYYSSKQSGLVCKEELEDLRKQVGYAQQSFFAEMKKVFPVWPPMERKVIYEPCDPRYKDWNDQVRDIPKEQEVKEETEEESERRNGGRRR